MGYVRSSALLAIAMVAAAAGPAHAGQVIEVDGNHAQRVFDPAVPTRVG